MAQPVVLKYKEDPTGVNPSNRVVDEPHAVGNRRYRILIPEHGAFFKEGVVIVDARTRLPLTADDYKFAEYEAVVSKRFAKEVYSVILITNQTLTTDTFLFTGQYVGGESSYSSSAIQRMYEDVMKDDRPVHWGDILGKDKFLNPLDHLHDAGDNFGQEYVVQALEAVRRAILMGDSASHDMILELIDRGNQALEVKIQDLADALTRHIQDKNDPHDVTKDQVGLGNIPNSITDERLLNSMASLLTAKALYDHNQSGDHDSRYIKLETGSNAIRMRERAGRIEIAIGAASTWTQIYPPVWQ